MTCLLNYCRPRPALKDFSFIFRLGLRDINFLKWRQVWLGLLVTWRDMQLKLFEACLMTNSSKLTFGSDNLKFIHGLNWPSMTWSDIVEKLLLIVLNCIKTGLYWPPNISALYWNPMIEDGLHLLSRRGPKSVCAWLDMFLPEKGEMFKKKASVPRHHIPNRCTMLSLKGRVLTYCCCLICWWYPLWGFCVKSPRLYYRLVRLKHNPSLLLQEILYEANPDRATVTTDPAGVGKACKASRSVPARALLLMVDNPTGPIRNIQMKHTQKPEGKHQEEKREQDRKGMERDGKERTLEDIRKGGDKGRSHSVGGMVKESQE